MKISDRDSSIDLLKGLGIVAVILGHLEIPMLLRSFIYMFHMPLFFFLSGYLRKEKSYKACDIWSRYAKKLLYPYFAGGVLIIVFNTMWDMLAGNFTYRKLWKRAIALLYGNYIWEDNASYIGVLWFLAALFCVSCLYELIHKFEKNNFRITIRVIYLFIFGVLIKTMLVDLGYRLPFCLDISLLVLPFYHLGYRMNLYLKEHKNMPRQRYYLFFSIFIFGGISGILNIAHMKTYGYAKQYVDVLYLNLGDLFLFLAAGCCISCSLLFLCKYIIKAECRFLKSCGRLSLLIMITHLYVLQIMRVVIDRLDIGYHVWMVAIILTSVSYIVSVCINRYFKWMFQFPFKVKNNLDMQ